MEVHYDQDKYKDLVFTIQEDDDVRKLYALSKAG